MSRIRVTIDRIALQGFGPAERTALIEGIQSELKHTLANPASRAALQSKRTPVLRLGTLPHQPGLSGSRRLGTAIARGIEKNMKP